MQALATDQPQPKPLSRAKALMRCLRCGLDPFATMLDYGTVELREADPDFVVLPRHLTVTTPCPSRFYRLSHEPPRQSSQPAYRSGARARLEPLARSLLCDAP